MARINVLVVDDSVVVRRLVTTVLEDDPEISVVGTAANGRIALSKLAQVAPDCVTLDIEMPELDGLETLRALRRTHPRLPVIMFSTLTERGAGATLDALALGASDYVCKPANVGSVPQAIASVREQLVPKIKALCPPRLAAAGPVPAGSGLRRPPLVRGPLTAGATAAPGPLGAPRGSVLASGPTGPRSGRVDVLTIGSSTGGPDALTTLLPQLPASFPVPVVVVQHMPPVFTRMFAQRLDGKCALEVKEAEDGDLVRPGRVLVAPGDRHLELRRQGASVVARLTSGPPENFCRPAVDVLFRSVSDLYGAGALAVVLTGMGSDGARGAEVLRRGGSEVVAQDETSSVVWGMPGAVVAAGLAHRVLPLSSIGPDVLRAVARGRAGAPVGAAR